MSSIPNHTPDVLGRLRKAQSALARFDVLLPPVLRINANLIEAKTDLLLAIGELVTERHDAARMLKNAEPRPDDGGPMPMRGEVSGYSPGLEPNFSKEKKQ